MFAICRHCPNRKTCQRLGCYAFNKDARRKADEEAKALRELQQLGHEYDSK